LKIVYVTSESYIDHSYTIAKELKKNVDLKIIIHGRKKTSEIENWCKLLGADFVERKRFRNPISFFTNIAFILGIRMIKPDLVWFNTFTVYQLFLVRIFLRKFLVMVHDVEIHPGNRSKHGKLSVKLTLAFYSRNVAVASREQAKLFNKKFGFDPPVFQLPVIDYYKDISASAGKINSGNEIKFFFFGSIEEYKGIDVLIDAVEILQKKTLNFKLNIYGKLNFDKLRLENRLRNLKNTQIFNEFINYLNIHDIYQTNDVLILPYKQVTQCGPLLIAFSELVPSICSDLDGFREYIDDRNNGIIFSNTAEDLADKMLKFIEDKDLALKIKNNIANDTFQKFLIKNLIKGYIKNFEEMINR
jgi:glycosyltransferase involved in cell wall biosynthesis